MSRPRISVIVPSAGRRSLRRTLQSCRWADEVVVVFDAAEPPRRPRGCVVLAVGPTRAWGNAQRNAGIAAATGTHLAFMDDDDVYTRHAGRLIRAAVRAAPARVHVFCMRYGGKGGRVLCGPVEAEQISTQMFVVPRRPVGVWTDRYAADFDFISETMRLRGDEPVFHPEVIAEIRPRTLRHRLGDRRLRLQTHVRRLAGRVVRRGRSSRPDR